MDGKGYHRSMQTAERIQNRCGRHKRIPDELQERFQRINWRDDNA